MRRLVAAVRSATPAALCARASSARQTSGSASRSRVGAARWAGVGTEALAPRAEKAAATQFRLELRLSSSDPES